MLVAIVYSFLLRDSFHLHCIISPSGKSFSGREFDAMSADQQANACRGAKLFSRVEPAHKSKIVDYLQQDGAVAAMVSMMCDMRGRRAHFTNTVEPL